MSNAREISHSAPQPTDADKPSVEKWVSPAITAVYFALFFYRALVWDKLRADVRLPVTSVLIALVALATIYGLKKYYRSFDIAGNFITLVLTISLVLAVGIVFEGDDRTKILKLFAVSYFAFLPGWLYLQFIATRGKTIWEEYVTNLFRLRIDEDANLPEPPPNSVFFEQWSRGRRSKAANDENLYKKKFEAVYGKVTDFKIFQGENMLPVALATMLIAVGWVIVAAPDPVFALHLPNAGEASAGAAARGGLDLPVKDLRFAFLGAYFYILQMMVRRYFQNDLRTNAYVNATTRIVIVFLLVWVISEVLPSGGSRIALAFTIGVFPQVGLQVLIESVKWPFKGIVKSMHRDYPLSTLDGLTPWYESHLLEQGIEDMQNLATCSLVDTMLNTRIPIERLVDWVDQSLLILHLGTDAKERAELRKFGIRTATDLEDIFAVIVNDLDDGDARARLSRLLSVADGPSRLQSILKTFRHEPNLFHIRTWKSFPETYLALGAIAQAPATPCEPPFLHVSAGSGNDQPVTAPESQV